MKTKYIIKNKIYRGYLIILYFLIIIFFFFAFSLNIYIPEKIETYGVVSNYIQEKTVYSSYKGRIDSVYIYEDSDIIKGQHIIDVYIDSKENIKRENDISRLKLLLEKEKKLDLINYYKKELEILNNIKQYKTIYFNPPEGDTFTVDNVFIKRNQNIDYQEKLFTYNDNSNKNFYYIEAFITPDLFNIINEEDIVIVDFYEFNNKTIKYQARINKKHNQIFQNDIVLKKTNGKIDNLAYKVDIRLINYPKNIKSGLGVHIYIIKEEISLFYYVVNYLKGIYDI